jgi:2-dehydro-3-deoxyglucarate aldolase/4-hydroxy-2-oxoheptanedioate aldolase
MTEVLFSDRLRAGETLVGTLVSVPSPELAEALSLAGLDWLFIDMEHGSFDRSDVVRALQAIRPPCAGVVRVPAAAEAWLKAALDSGAHGVIVPHVNSVAMARELVHWSKYPPQGARSVGIARAHGYGLHFAEAMRSANDRVAVIAQIEHIDAVHDIDAIAAVDGLDALFVGPYDLSASMGLTGQTDHPDVQAAIERVTAACRGKRPLGIFGATPEAVRPHRDAGYSLLAVGMDLMHLTGAVREMAAAVRDG